MKYKGKKEDLLRALNIVSRLASTRSTLPILQNIYLEAIDDGLVFRSTNLEQTLETIISGEVEEKGKITIPARLLNEYCQNNPDQYIQLNINDLVINIHSQNHRATLKGLPAEEYPTLPSFKTDTSIHLPTPPLVEALTKTLFAAATDDSRPILNGILWRFKDKKLELVATDGYRLALTSIDIPNSYSGDYILPKNSLQELLRVLNTPEVELRFAGNQIMFVFGESKFTSRILDGKFPDYEAILPKKKDLQLELNTSQLLQSLKLASLFSRDSAFSTKLEFSQNRLVITAVSPQLGENSNEVMLEKSIEKPLTISCNAQYIIDALGNFSKSVIVELFDANSPIVLKSPTQSTDLYLLMPLRNQ